MLYPVRFRNPARHPPGDRLKDKNHLDTSDTIKVKCVVVRAYFYLVLFISKHNTPYYCSNPKQLATCSYVDLSDVLEREPIRYSI